MRVWDTVQTTVIIDGHIFLTRRLFNIYLLFNIIYYLTSRVE